MRKNFDDWLYNGDWQLKKSSRIPADVLYAAATHPNFSGTTEDIERFIGR